MMEAKTASVDGRVLLSDARDRLVKNQAWRAYVDGVYAIDQQDYPFLTYVGINFTKTAIRNFKFYFSFFRRLSPKELETVLPVPVAARQRFDAFYAKWQPTKNYNMIHRGVTFALKVGADGELTHYYHLRLPGRPGGEPSRLMLSLSDRNHHHGVCEEFSGRDVSLKKYFYCRDQATIVRSLEAAGFPDLVGEAPSVEWLEYIESDRRDKAAWITGNQTLLTALVERRGPPHLLGALEMFCRRLGFLPYGPGSSRDEADHSIYFVEPTGTPAGSRYVFDGVRRFMTHYLRVR